MSDEARRVAGTLSSGAILLLKNTNRIIRKSDWKVMGPNDGAFEICRVRKLIELIMKDAWVLTEFGKEVQAEILKSKEVK